MTYNRRPACPAYNASYRAVTMAVEQCVAVTAQNALRGVTDLDTLAMLFGMWRDDLSLVVPWLSECRRFVHAANVARNTLDAVEAEYRSFTW